MKGFIITVLLSLFPARALAVAHSGTCSSGTTTFADEDTISGTLTVATTCTYQTPATYADVYFAAGALLTITTGEFNSQGTTYGTRTVFQDDSTGNAAQWNLGGTIRITGTTSTDISYIEQRQCTTTGCFELNAAKAGATISNLIIRDSGYGFEDTGTLSAASISNVIWVGGKKAASGPWDLDAAAHTGTVDNFFWYSAGEMRTNFADDSVSDYNYTQWVIMNGELNFSGSSITPTVTDLYLIHGGNGVGAMSANMGASASLTVDTCALYSGEDGGGGNIGFTFTAGAITLQNCDIIGFGNDAMDESLGGAAENESGNYIAGNNAAIIGFAATSTTCADAIQQCDTTLTRTGPETSRNLLYTTASVTYNTNTAGQITASFDTASGVNSKIAWGIGLLRCGTVSGTYTHYSEQATQMHAPYLLANYGDFPLTHGMAWIGMHANGLTYRQTAHSVSLGSLAGGTWYCDTGIQDPFGNIHWNGSVSSALTVAGTAAVGGDLAGSELR